MGKNNISKLFYKDYYKEIDFTYACRGDNECGKSNQDKINDINRSIKDSELVDIPPLKFESCSEKYYDEPMRFKILYPGLVTGIGLVHDSKKIKGAFNLGMHFDYTYGMPVVYGSSVKGVLRQYFKEFYQGEIDKDELLKDIFSGITSDGVRKSVYDRDIFFDAVIVESYSDGNDNEHLLEDDSITPHGKDPLKNPIPITMLKIAAGCKIEFRFCLKDSLVDGKLFKAKQKWDCFKEILKTVGVGAKTNVGYGQLEAIC